MRDFPHRALVLTVLGSVIIAPASLRATPATRDIVPSTRFAASQPTSTVEQTFSVGTPLTCPCVLRAVNGPDDPASENRTRVGSGWIWIDDLEVLAPPRLTRAARIVEIPVNLPAGIHRLRVRLAGPPGSAVTVAISGIIALPDLPDARTGHRAVLAAAGAVRIAGGASTTGLATNQLAFDPSTLQWQSASWPGQPASHAAVVATPDGGLLRLGGERNGVVGDADFVAADGATTAATPLVAGRSGHTATTLRDGRVLVLGGTDAGGAALATSEIVDARPDPFGDGIFDTRSATVAPGPVALSIARSGHTATRLADGRVLVVGGRSAAGVHASIELVDPAAGTSVVLPVALQQARAGHTATVLADGRILIAGGAGPSGLLDSIEIIGADRASVALTSDRLTRARSDHSAALLLWGDVLIAGGSTADGPTPHTELVTGAPPSSAIGASVVFPAGGSADVDRGTLVTLAFDQPIDASSLDGAVVITAGGQAIAVDMRVIEEGTLVAIRPLAPLPAGSQVDVSLAGLRTRGGRDLAPVSWTFFTVPQAEVTGLTPTHGPPNTPVTIAGSHFPADPLQVRVRLGAVAVAAVSSSATEIGIVIPADTPAGSVAVSVTTRGGPAIGAPLFEVESIVTGPTPVSLEINPRGSALSIGDTQSFTATALYADGTHGDVTGEATWSSTAPGVVSASSGISTGVAPGTAEVSVAFRSLSATAVVKVYAGDPIPVDPSLVAPNNDPTVSTPFATSNRFLFEAENPIQRDVQPGAIEDRRLAVVRGGVTRADGSALAGARVTAAGQPALGYTLSREDGAFDFAVNGGGVITLQVALAGHLPAERQVTPQWRDYSMLDSIALVALDPVATPVDLAAAVTPVVARGSVVEDADGSRQATLVFSPGTVASVTLPDGSSADVPHLTVRATEYTVGPQGVKAMPAPLPATSAYTYAVEFSVDELAALGVSDVRFSKPVVSYTDNFLAFPAGQAVPVAYYDRSRHAWVPQPNGRVIKVLSETGGVADLDVTGSGTPSPAGALDALGITSEERQTIASVYEPGDSVWRVRVDHFSPYDLNWPRRPPPDSQYPSNAAPDGGTNGELDQDDCRPGSIIECQSQSIGEEIPLVGTGISLTYRGSRVPRRRSAYTISGQLIGSTVPPNVKRAELIIRIAGQELFSTYPAQPNQRFSFTWDGKDAYNREVHGTAEAIVDVGYVYNANYSAAAPGDRSFGQSGTGTITADQTRNEVTLWQTHTVLLGTLALGAAESNGWSLSAHHVYDPRSLTVFYGTGQRQGIEGLPMTLATAAGLPVQSGGSIPPPPTPATQLSLIRPQGLVVIADGTFYLTNGTSTGAIQATYRIDPAGQVAQVADASFGVIRAVATDGTLYFVSATSHVVRAKHSNGTAVVIAGQVNQSGFAGDGGLATAARLTAPSDVAIDRDGTIFIADRGNNRIRRIAPDGYISTIAGGGIRSASFVDQPALEIFLSSPNAVAIAPSGRVFAAYGGTVAQINPDGTLRTFTGGINVAQDVDVAWDGTVYVTQVSGNSGTVLRVDTANNRTVVAAASFVIAEKGPATTSLTNAPQAVAVSPDGSVLILTATPTSTPARVQRLGRPRTNDPLRPLDLVIPSLDATEIFTFDTAGRHLSTLDALTGGLKLLFHYDAKGRLASITDSDDRTLTLERSGGRLAGIVAPNGQRTTIVSNNTGLIESVTQPGGGTWRLGYTPDGLLSSFQRPGEQTSTFEYEDGRLTRDADGIGFTLLSSSRTSRSWTAFTTTAENRTESFLVERLTNGSIRRTNTDPSGLQTVVVKESGGRQIKTLPDATVITATPGADPRWGTQTTFSQFVTMDVPSLPRFTFTTSKSTQLATPANPLSVTLLNHSTTVGLRTLFSRNYDGNLRRLSESDGSFGLTTYLDAEGRPTRFEEPLTNATVFGYDDRGRLETLVQGVRSTAVGYDEHDRPVTVTDAVGRTFEFAFDANGHVRSQTLPDTNVIAYEPDADGNVLSVTPPGRPAHRFTFTPTGLIETYRPPPVVNEEITQYHYNRDRQLTSIQRPESTTTFGYDNGGRLKAVTAPDAAMGIEYGSGGLVQRMTMSGGPTLEFGYSGPFRTRDAWSGLVTGEVTRTYSDEMRLRTERVNGGHLVTYSYDNGYLRMAANGLTLERLGGKPTVLSMGRITERITYNAFGEPFIRQTTDNFQPLFRTDYTFDNLGRVTRIVEAIDGVTRVLEYGYDLRGRLDTVRRNGALLVVYGFDANGNRVTADGQLGHVEATYDDQDRLRTYGAATFSYTSNGELASKETGGQTTRYAYDGLGNLRRVELPDGRVIRYIVDGRGRRVRKLVDDVPVRGWLWDDDLRPIAELDGAAVVTMRFVYVSRDTVPDFIMKGTDTFRIVGDHLGNPRVVINTATGAIVQRLDFGAFGELLQDSSPGWQPFGFAGGLYDADTGLVHFGAREYAPEYGRWLTPDPLSFWGASTNLYTYVLGDPVNLIDPDGTLPLLLPALAGAVIGAAVSGGSAIASNAMAGRAPLEGVGAAVVSGAATGALSALGGPIGGTIARALGGKATGALAKGVATAISSAGGAAGQALENAMSPCTGSHIGNAAVYAGLGGLVGANIPIRGMASLAQAEHFAPRTLNGLTATENARSLLSALAATGFVETLSNFSGPFQ